MRSSISMKYYRQPKESQANFEDLRCMGINIGTTLEKEKQRG